MWLQTGGPLRQGQDVPGPYSSVQLEDGLVVSVLARFRFSCAGLNPWRVVACFGLGCWFCCLEVTLY